MLTSVWRLLPQGPANRAHDAAAGPAARTRELPLEETGRGRQTGHVVIVGNCLAESIHAGLSSNHLATSFYHFSAVPVHIISLQDEAVQRVLSRATHVFVLQHGHIDVQTVKNAIPIGCKLRMYPDIVFRSAWPFDESNGYSDAEIAGRPVGVIRHVDGALSKLRKFQPDKKKRICAYVELDFPMASEIPLKIETQTRFLASIDERSDVGIGQYVLRNYKLKPMFYDSTHPSQWVFQKYCEFIWTVVGLPGTPPLLSGMDTWRDWSVPIHPLIARRLGLNYANEHTKYRYATLGEVTWREWIEAYVEILG